MEILNFGASKEQKQKAVHIDDIKWSDSKQSEVESNDFKGRGGVRECGVKPFGT